MTLTERIEKIEQVIKAITEEIKAMLAEPPDETPPDDVTDPPDDTKAGRRVQKPRMDQLSGMLESLSAVQSQLMDMLAWASYFDKTPTEFRPGLGTQGGKAMSLHFDLSQDLDALELAPIGLALKAAYDLDQSLTGALKAIQDNDHNRAIALLQGALDQGDERDDKGGCGYKSGSATPEVVSAGIVDRFVGRAMGILEADEPDTAQAAKAIEGLLGQLSGEAKMGGSAGACRAKLMSAARMLGQPNPDMGRVASILRTALRSITGGGDDDDDNPGRRKRKEREKGMGYEEPGKAIDLDDPDTLAIKTLHEDQEGAVVGGYLALWGDPATRDLQGDYFTPETETWIDVYKSVPALFHHGLDKAVGLAPVGHRMTAEADDVGIWVEDWLNKSSKYWRMVRPLLRAKALFYSPGSAAHLVKREEDGRLLSFPVVEDTLTPMPAQHRLWQRPVEQIKAAWEASGLEIPEGMLNGNPPDLKASVDADLAEIEGILA